MRKGTLIYTPQPSDFEGLNEIEFVSNTQNPKLPPVDGGTEGGIITYIQSNHMPLKPVETIRTGDFVIGHDGKLHRVLQVIQRHYHGDMIAIKHNQSDNTLYLPEYQRILSQRRVQQLTPNGKWSGIPSSHFERARELRKEATPPERILWEYLSKGQLGVKFRRQHPIGPYIADFYTRDCGLVVEVDGEANHANPDQIEYDQVRDRFMNQLGLQVLRIPAIDVFRQPENVVAEIMSHTLEHVLNDDYSKQWIYAKRLQANDIIYRGNNTHACMLAAVERTQINETIICLQIADVHSYLTSVAIVHDFPPC